MHGSEWTCKVFQFYPSYQNRIWTRKSYPYTPDKSYIPVNFLSLCSISSKNRYFRAFQCYWLNSTSFLVPSLTSWSSFHLLCVMPKQKRKHICLNQQFFTCFRTTLYCTRVKRLNPLNTLSILDFFSRQSHLFISKASSTHLTNCLSLSNDWW